MHCYCRLCARWNIDNSISNTERICLHSVVNLNLLSRMIDNHLSSYAEDVDLKKLEEVPITTIKKQPTSVLKIGLAAAKSAVLFYDKLLFPQSLKLFSCESADENQMLIDEKKIVQFDMNYFSISDLSYHGPFHSNSLLC